MVVSRRVSSDCLVAFEGRRYSVPFAWIEREVDHRARLQLAGLSAPSFDRVIQLPDVARIPRPIDAYAQLVKAIR